MPDEKPAWWNDKSQAVYSRLPDGAEMGFSEGESRGRDRLGMDRWHILRRIEKATPAPETFTPDSAA